MTLMNVYKTVNYIKAHCEASFAFNTVDAV